MTTGQLVIAVCLLSFTLGFMARDALLAKPKGKRRDRHDDDNNNIGPPSFA